MGVEVLDGTNGIMEPAGPKRVHFIPFVTSKSYGVPEINHFENHWNRALIIMSNACEGGT